MYNSFSGKSTNVSFSFLFYSRVEKWLVQTLEVNQFFLGSNSQAF